jgi:hypothetical protein
MRQLTFACARCGRAFGACPALTIVATQVVRSMLFQLAFPAQIRSAAASSAESLRTREYRRLCGRPEPGLRLEVRAR